MYIAFTSHLRVFNKFHNCSHEEEVSIYYSESEISRKEHQKEEIEHFFDGLSIVNFSKMNENSRGFLFLFIFLRGCWQLLRITLVIESLMLWKKLSLQTVEITRAWSHEAKPSYFVFRILE